MALSLLCLGLTACGGGGNGGSGSASVTPAAASSPGMLKQVSSADEMRASMTTALSGANYSSGVIVAPVATDEGLALSPSTGGFSTTTLQEQGVDEADVVKYDGEILYVLTNSNFVIIDDADDSADDALGLSIAPTNSVITLYRTDTETPATEQVASIALEDIGFGAGLYLYDGTNERQLVAVGQSGDPWGWAQFANDMLWQGYHTEVTSWGVSNPEAPAQTWSLQLQGALLTSRRIEDTLYLVTRFTPVIDGLEPYPATPEQIAANEAIVAETPLDDMLPDMLIGNGSPRELLTAGDCYVPNNDYEGDILPPAGGSLITVTAVDLAAPDNIRSVCINSFANGFYASRDSLYITAMSSTDRTVVHKIALDEDGPDYRGSGDVRGYLATHNPSFMMSENNSDLRVMSSVWAFTDFPQLTFEDSRSDQDEISVEPEVDLGRHFLTVLRESADGDHLEAVAELPNIERPRRIGKPGEDIYAARFLGDRAYVVTFETIDPLYVLDLSVAEDPRVAGELEIPGFSTLLQPLAENLLLGVGSDAVAQGPGFAGGVKLSLFDVADISNPIELGSEVIGKRGSYSAAQHDHHALTLLPVTSGYRVALPVQRHDALPEGVDPADPWAWYDWSDSGLYQFEVNPATGELAYVGTLVSEQRTDEQPWPQFESYYSRSVLHDEAVFLVQPPRVFTGLWGQ